MIHEKLHLLVSPACIRLALVEKTSAEQQNITIDDAYSGGDDSISLSYLPVNGWSVGNTCKRCSARPNRSQILDETWHDASSMHDDSFQRSIGFHFTGIAVYSYFILANDFTFKSLTNLTFLMDGEEDGSFLHLPSPDPTFEYNALVYSKADLKNDGPHSLNISTTGDNTSLILFDYFKYTADISTPGSNGPTPTSINNIIPSILPIPQSPLPSTIISMEVSTKKPSSNLILGLVIGAIAFLLLISLYLMWRWRKRRTSAFGHVHRHHHDDPRSIPNIPRRASEDTLPVYTPRNVDLSAPAEHNIPPPAVSGQPLQIDEIQRNIEELREELTQGSGPAGFLWQREDAISVARATIQSSESVSHIRIQDEMTVPWVRKQIKALRAQVCQWEEQLTSASRLPLNRASD